MLIYGSGNHTSLDFHAETRMKIAVGNSKIQNFILADQIDTRVRYTPITNVSALEFAVIRINHIKI